MSRRLSVPEVIQSSDTDCGPASIASFLAGFGIQVPYERLRERCGTDLDGTSIDDLEDAAVACGLDAHQTLVPAEHLASGGAGLLPAIAVLALPGGIAHFVVVWRRIGGWFQVMDPMVGRRWMRRRDLLDVLYRHRGSIPADVWRGWAGTEANVGPLRFRLSQAGVPRAATDALLDEALADASWRSLATLDALARLLESVAEARGRAASREAAQLVAGFVGALADQTWVPVRFYSAHGEADADLLTLVGAVLVTADGRTDRGDAEPATVAAPIGVLGPLVDRLRADGSLAPAALAAAAALAGATAAFEALLFKGVLEMGGLLHTPDQRVAGVLAVAGFSAAVLLLELRLAIGIRALGRRLETRLRVAFLRKLVRLPDGWFASRLTSDLTLRVHAVVRLRGVPALGESVLRTFAALVCTVAGLVWIDPGCAGVALLGLALAVGLPLAFQSRLAELQLASATWQGGLSRYLLDALLGVLPLRSYGAQQVIRAEHDRLLARWTRSRRELLRASVVVDAAIHGVGLLTAGLILYGHLQRTADPSSVLLLVFWASQLPTLGRLLARDLLEVPARRAVAARIFEPIHAADEAQTGTVRPDALGVAFHGVTLDLGRTRLLDGVDLVVDPGQHCAILGASGAGKSTLLGLLLGWHRPTGGAVEVAGHPLDDHDRDALSAGIAWIDPQVQLWNRSLYDNLTYGIDPADGDLAEVIDVSGLRATLDKLPEGLATVLGEGGSALSQGEAQRVRIARALLRRDARLVLLDEPFRGLDRETRARLLHRIRGWWPDATLLCVTHDLHETRTFDRVVVLDGGRVLESGAPGALLRQPRSLYADLVEAERQVRSFLDDSPVWTRWTVDGGRLEKRSPRRLDLGAAG